VSDMGQWRCIGALPMKIYADCKEIPSLSARFVLFWGQSL
jgi:hypothetical protein